MIYYRKNPKRKQRHQRTWKNRKKPDENLRKPGKRYVNDNDNVNVNDNDNVNVIVNRYRLRPGAGSTGVCCETQWVNWFFQRLTIGKLWRTIGHCEFAERDETI